MYLYSLFSQTITIILSTPDALYGLSDRPMLTHEFVCLCLLHFLTYPFIDRVAVTVS